MVAITNPRPYGRPVIVERKPSTKTATLDVPSSPVPSTSSVSSSPRAVRFAETPDQASRPVEAVEHWSAYRWEQHALNCRYCKHPGDVFRNGGSLCAEGHAYAQDISLLARYRDGEIYSTERDAAGSLVRLEFPPDYRRLRSLLRAQEHSLKARKPIITYDEPRATAPEPPISARRTTPYDTAIITPATTRRSSRSYPQPGLPRRRDSVHEASRNPLFCDDSEGERRPSAPRRSQTTSTVAPTDSYGYPITNAPRTASTTAYPRDADSRGSLYVADLARQQAAYRVEIREPSSSTSRRERRTSVWY